MVVASFHQICLYLAWTGTSVAIMIVQYSASNVLYANQFAMKEKCLFQNITEWDNLGIGQILERHRPISKIGEMFCRQNILQAHKQKSKILSNIFVIHSILEQIYRTYFTP